MPEVASFSYPFATLQQLAEDVLKHARDKGATASEVDVSEGFGQSVAVRCDEVETIEFNRDKGVGITVYVGQRKGYASTSDFSPQALRETVEAALDIARFTAADDCAGLADVDGDPDPLVAVELDGFDLVATDTDRLAEALGHIDLAGCRALVAGMFQDILGKLLQRGERVGIAGNFGHERDVRTGKPLS